MRSWRESKTDIPPETCLLCFEEQVNQKIPDLQRKEVFFPCPKHGDPRVLLPENALWVGLYEMISPYLIPGEARRGEKIISFPLINIEVLRVFCYELHLDFLQTYQNLSLFHRGLYG